MSKSILITGASTGFGRHTAEALAKHGHQVFASMRDVSGRNRGDLKTKGISVVDIDVTDDDSVARGVASVIEAAGGLDVVINNAGIGAAGVSEAFGIDQVQRIFDVNVFGIQRTLRAVLPTFRAQGEGLIINIGSILGRVTFPFFGHYGASKFAVEALTDSYRYELSQLGIDVVLIQPSNYPTEIFGSAQPARDSDRAAGYGELGGIPEKMVGTLMELFASDNAPDPQDVAQTIATVIAQPAGQRAPRSVVGEAFGADALNAQAAGVQAQLIEGLGLGFLSDLRTA